MLSTTAQDDASDVPLSDPDDIEQCFGRRIDMLLDAGPGGILQTTVIDLSSGDPVLVRRGAGAVDHLLDLQGT